MGPVPGPVVSTPSPSQCPPLPQSICPFPTDSQEPVSFQVILTSSLYNRSSTRNQGSAWLDELQTHGWDSKTGAFIFLWPWSTGNLSNEELIIAERSFYSNTIQLPLCFHNYSSDWQLECEFSSLWVEAGLCVSWDPSSSRKEASLNLMCPHHEAESHHCGQSVEPDCDS